MGFFSKLFGKKNSSDVFTDDELKNAGVCPNCWGKQAYDGKYVDYYKDQTKSNISNDSQNKKAFIQQFVETNVTGIRLKSEEEKLVCGACNAKYNAN